MNKFLCVMVWAFMGIIPLKAQKEKTDISLYERISRIEKRTNRFNLYLNLQGGFNGYFDAGFTDSKFHFRDIRISANGNINEWLSYAYRQRLNRSNHSGANPDNLPNSRCGGDGSAFRRKIEYVRRKTQCRIRRNRIRYVSA